MLTDEKNLKNVRWISSCPYYHLQAVNGDVAKLTIPIYQGCVDADNQSVAGTSFRFLV